MGKWEGGRDKQVSGDARVIYRVLKEYDISDNPVWEWECDCEKCLTTPYQCLEVVIANCEERESPEVTALYPSLRRGDE